MTSYLLLAFLALATIVQPSTYIINQMFFTDVFTENDCLSWAPFGASIPILKFSDCSSHRIFGGYNIFVGDLVNPNGITKSWSNLIPHYSLTISATFYKLDSWKNNTIFFMVDGVTAYLQTFDYTNGGTTDFCGNPTPVSDSINTNFNDAIIPISFTVAHTAPTLTIRILSNLLGNGGSWGIRNLNITMQACDQSCASCNSANSCTSCHTAQGLTLLGSFCVCNGVNPVRMKFIPCPFLGTPCATCYPSSVSCTANPGYYYSTTTTNCEPCNIACGTCTSPVNSAATCGSCNSAGFIRTSLLTACFSCFSGCASCTSTAFNTCTSCSYGYFKYTIASTCVQTCPTGYYSIESTAACSPCNPPCSNCIGMNGGNYYCTSCIASYYLYNYACFQSCPNGLLGYQGVCLSSCPIGTYASVSFICTSCIANCKQCTNGTSCFICNTGAYMDTFGLCYFNCPANQYGDNTTMLCLSCHSSCGSTCFGPFSDNCLSCPAGIILIGSICYATCPSNTYSASCLPCHSSCLTCNGGTALNCLTCAFPLFYHSNFSSCLVTCNTGEISNNYNFTCTQCPTGMVAHFQTCRPCSTTCLYCNGITFLDCTTCNPGTTLVKSTCVLSYDKTFIYMPNKPTGTYILDAFLGIFLTHFFVCLFIDAIFQYKTNLLLTIQLIQILSYTQFLAIQLSQSTQKLAHFMYITNFAAYLNPISVDPHPSLPTKFQVIGKTGVFLADSLGIQLVMIVSITLFLAVRYLSHRSQFFKKVYQKINPYLITYAFRLVLLELGLDIMLYLYCFDAGSGLGVGSLVMLLIDMIAFIFSLCWRIKTEQDGSQLAMFYYNQIGQDTKKEQQQLPEDEPVGISVQQKIRKSKILPSVMQLLLKIPISITILYFIGNSSTQSICYFIYFSFFLLLVVIVPVRRRVYRFVMILNASFLVLNALGVIIVARGGASNYFDGVWLTILIILFALTLLQIITNYNYFVQCFSYFKHQTKNGFSNKQQPPNHESQSNLASQEDQSVVFERHDAESPYRPSKKDQSKILSKNQLKNSWMQQKYG